MKYTLANGSKVWCENRSVWKFSTLTRVSRDEKCIRVNWWCVWPYSVRFKNFDSRWNIIQKCLDTFSGLDVITFSNTLLFSVIITKFMAHIKQNDDEK